MFKRKTVKLITVLLAIILLMQSLMILGVNAAPAVKKFTVDNVSGKSTYYEGEIFSPEGYVGTTKFSDDSETVQSGAELIYTIASPLTADTAVVFTCPANSALTTSLPVSVIGITAIEVSGEYKNVYLEGEEFFDPTGVVLTLKYADNSYVKYTYTESSGVLTELATSSSVIPSSSDFVFSAETGSPLSSSSVCSVSLTTGTHTVSTDIPVTLRPLLSLEITKKPDTVLHEGIALELASGDLTVMGTYEGISEAVELTNYTVDNIDSSVFDNGTGLMTYYVSLGGITGSFELPVTNIDMFYITSSTGIQHLYCHSDASHKNVFDPEPITISAIYLNGDMINITDLVDFNYPAVIESGSVVSAAFAGKDISLSEVLQIHRAEMEIVRSPDTVNYVPGGTFNPEGFAAKVRYDDDTTVYLDAADVIFEVNTPLTANDAYATAIWSGGISCQIPIYVETGESITLSIETPPETVKYVEGQYLSLEGMSVYVAVGDGEPTALSLDSIVTIPAVTEKLTAGTSYFTVRYYVNPTVYYETTQAIEVDSRRATAIFVAAGNDPDKTEYEEGEKINLKGMKLSVSYNDGSTRVLTSGFSGSSTPFILKSNEAVQTVPVTISYGSLQCYYNVQVRAKAIDKISVISAPINTKYIAGAVFSPEGMKVAVYYADSPTVPVEIDSSYYSYSPSGKLTGKDTEITVYFRGMTASVQIEIIGGEITTVPVETSAEPEESTAPSESTAEVTSNYPEVTTKTPEITTSGTATTPVTTGSGSGNTGSGGSPIIILWIIIISLILILLVVLIVYYKKHFT